ncbi:MAG: hypothetical protein ACTSR7_13410 [Promethearchaeota archaeon]
MNNLLNQIEEILLMGPGPSCIHPKVYEALSCKTLGHLDPYFIKIMDEIQELLKKLMNTKNNLTLPLSGNFTTFRYRLSGNGGMFCESS